MMCFDEDAQAKNVAYKTVLLGFRLGFLNLGFNGIQSPDHHVLIINGYSRRHGLRE